MVKPLSNSLRINQCQISWLFNPSSVIVMDNCSTYHVDHIMALLQEIGILIQWLPPYSPDLNPLEEVFSKVMKSMETEMQMLNGKICSFSFFHQ